MPLILYLFLFLVQEDLPFVFSAYPENSRAILIFSPDNRSEQYTHSLTNLITDPLGVDMRDIRIFEIFTEGGIGPAGESYSSEDVNSIRKFYHIKPEDFRILLTVGNFKELYRSDKPLKLDHIFKIFDGEE